MPNTRLILHVKGTEKTTTELPKQIVRAAISQGQITHSQLIWSAADNAWKQVRELPHLLPSQKLAPAPLRAPSGTLAKVTASGSVPRIAQTGTVPRIAAQTGSVPRVAAQTGTVPRIAAQTGAVPRVAVQTGAVPNVAARTAASPVGTKDEVKEVEAPASSRVEEETEFQPMKWLCIFVGVLVLLAVIVNYFLVDRALVARFKATPFANVGIFGHLGAFVQPNVLIIHISRSTTVTRENVTDFLAQLAASTPSEPMSNNPYERVALTAGWMGEYSFSGMAWKDLADMGNAGVEQRKEFILDQICDAAGNPLASTAGSTLNQQDQQKLRDRVWKEVSGHFSSGP